MHFSTIYYIIVILLHALLRSRLFAKQVEFEDALTAMAKRNEEQSELLSRIADLEKQSDKQQAHFRRWNTN